MSLRQVIPFSRIAQCVLVAVLSGCGHTVQNEDPANELPPFSGHKAPVYSTFEKWWLDPLHWNSAIWLEEKK